MNVHRVAPDISVLAEHLEVPGIGFLAVNAFVLHAAEPVVIDTGLGLPDRDFLAALSKVVDPADVQWIWLTHPDPDHTGALFDLLAAAPGARLVTTFLSVGIMATTRPLPIERVYLLNPGQPLDVGDRQLSAFRPPLFDSPATLGFYDHATGACFSSDCFGAPLPSPDLAVADTVNDMPAEDLAAAQLLWATVDSPWVHAVDQARHLANLAPLRAAAPTMILSTHLPPAQDRTTTFIDTLAAAPAAEPFIGPDQAVLETMLAGSSATPVS